MADVDDVAKVIHARMLREAEMEGGPGSGPQGGGARKQKYVPQHIAQKNRDIASGKRVDRDQARQRSATQRGARGNMSTKGLQQQRGYFSSEGGPGSGPRKGGGRSGPRDTGAGAGVPPPIAKGNLQSLSDKDLNNTHVLLQDKLERSGSPERSAKLRDKIKDVEKEIGRRSHERTGGA